MIFEKTNYPRIKDVGETNNLDSDFLENMVRLLHIYSGAMHTASVQLEILDSEFAAIYEHSPIHHMERRVKSIESIVNKMSRKGLKIDIDYVYKIQDIAGIRVICNYVEDIYYLRNLIIEKTDFELISESDYIKNPKPNGYRSLHLIVRVLFVISEGRIEMPVEIQLLIDFVKVCCGYFLFFYLSAGTVIDNQPLHPVFECLVGVLAEMHLDRIGCVSQLPLEAGRLLFTLCHSILLSHEKKRL